eukprot:symbB.v1.2.000002.t1/scaffold5.1/size591573/2
MKSFFRGWWKLLSFGYTTNFMEASIAMTADTMTAATLPVASSTWVSPSVQKWTFHQPSDGDGKNKARNLTWSEALELMENSQRFREMLISKLQESPFNAFFWECTPLTEHTAQRRSFEFVIMEGSHLDSARPDTESFADYLADFKGQPVARAFANLGGDSSLISPAQATKNPEDYKHIGNFFRRAPMEQRHAVWQTLGQELQRRLAQKPEAPYWVSTEGSGVAWLHMRIDPRPKYYHHREYRSPEYGLVQKGEL